MPQPTEDWLRLHVLVCRGNAQAFERLAARLLPVLVQQLACWIAGSDSEDREDSVEDALLAYRDRPERFDPGRHVPLPYFLALMARGRLLHRLRGRARRERREATGLFGNFLEKNCETRATFWLGRGIIHRDPDETGSREQVLERLLPYLEPREGAEVDLLRRGIQALEPWAELLEIQSLPLPIQRARIKNEKVRLRRKLKELARRCRLIEDAAG